MTEFRMQADVAEQDVEGYRPLSVPAILAAILGALSIIVVFSAYGLIFPAAAILTSIWALISIHRSRGVLVGRTAALAGLYCAVACLCILAGRLAYEHRQTYQQARIFADGWLQLLLQDRWEAADQATLPLSKREFSTRTVKAAYANQVKLQKQWSEFVKMSPLADVMRKWGPSTELRFMGAVQQRYLKTQRAVLLHYEATPPNQPPVKIKLWVVRDDPLFGGPYCWFTKEVARL